MKVRHLLTSAALAAAVSFSASASTENSQTQSAISNMAAGFVKAAVKSTVTELNRATMKEVLTANVHLDMETVEPTLVTKVEIVDIKSKG
ncbi:hypothetical protein DRW07_09910 [Alteromonas sediminis]|uniref:Uncharacterized protein n=1 Tax=Alteromonas sediminis TaxID=2259342 RepID=A0A3N5Y058_9ALTE|nr:hypothetical protein [Alteromonas sediminis]RPJ66400.1 hypothetical protein DRW07_09910 [Alteromonas sediminis]